ncbi:MAG: hypothetical protein JW850_18530 [Thermoflexales bacterium]|nr:hypothetical protein [Thermoflexales bacterium]
MRESIGEPWQQVLWQTVQHHKNADSLRDAALRGHLGDWTRALTDVVVTACRAMGWQVAAKGHPLDLFPESRHEYLSMDVMAFAQEQRRWQFPVAVMELENSRDDDRIAYSLWKVLCVRADLRIVFCYRRSPDQSSALIRFLCQEVISAMSLEERVKLEGETLVVVGSRDESATFPYGFFKWWQLETNTGTFQVI